MFSDHMRFCQNTIDRKTEIRLFIKHLTIHIKTRIRLGYISANLSFWINTLELKKGHNSFILGADMTGLAAELASGLPAFEASDAPLNLLFCTS